MPLLGRAERIARGKQQRKKRPRSIHAGWTAPANRPDPLVQLLHSHEARLPSLAAVRWGRMVSSPFGYLRGSAMVMAWDLAHAPHGELYVQACGDAHLCNFGTFATPERRLIFDLRDFDETLPAPWEWDVKRLGASVAVAARERGLAPDQADDAVVACGRAYRETLRLLLDLTHLEVWYRRVDAEDIEANASGKAKRYARRLLKKARKRTSLREVERLTVELDGQRRIKEERPLIFPVEPGVRDDARSFLADYVESLSPDRRVLFQRYEIVDVAYRVVGVGSVGTRCLVALLHGDADDDPLFLQIKEANRSVLEPFARRCPYENQGERVVQGQRIIQAASDLFLGWKHRSGHDYYVRQLKDMKGTIDLAELPSEAIARYAALCGSTLAEAHARSGDFCQIAGYLGKNDQFDRALARFAGDYADQVERDHAQLERSVRNGRIPAELGA